jgi:DNA-directed RNA polymerase subunit RPC12/RpoP
MKNKSKVIEKKCQKCGSHNVQLTGAAHVIGSGQQKMREPDTFQYICAECGNIFFLSPSRVSK